MNNGALFYSAVLVAGVFISSFSQVLLKKSALTPRKGFVQEYLNPFVIAAYALFMAATFMTVYAFKGIPLSYGPILDSTGYLFVTLFGIIFFKERLNCKKTAGIAVILAGIIVYSLG